MSAWADTAWASGAWATGAWSTGTSSGSVDTSGAPTQTTIVHSVHSDIAVLTATSEIAPIENVQDVTRGLYWRGSIGVGSPDGAVIAGTYADGNARKAGFFGLFDHSLHGATGHLLLYPNDDWTGTPSYDSGPFTIGQLLDVGQSWGLIDGAAEDTDLLYYEQPLGIWFENTLHKSWKFFINGTPQASDGALSYYQIGRLVLGPWFEFSRSVDFGPALTHRNNTTRNRTGGGTNARAPGAKWRVLEANMRTVSDDDQFAMMQLMDYMGTGRDGVLALFPSDSGWKGRYFLMNGCFSTEAAYTLDFALAAQKLVFESN